MAKRMVRPGGGRVYDQRVHPPAQALVAEQTLPKLPTKAPSPAMLSALHKIHKKLGAADLAAAKRSALVKPRERLEPAEVPAEKPLSRFIRIDTENLPRFLTPLRSLFEMFVNEQRVVYPHFSVKDIDNWAVNLAKSVQSEHFYLWIALLDRRPAGFFGGEIMWRAAGQPQVWANPHWLYVVPGARGLGLSRAMVLCGTKELRKYKIQWVEMVARHDDPQWRKRGWRPTYTIFAQTVRGIEAALEGNGHTKRMPTPEIVLGRR